MKNRWIADRLAVIIHLHGRFHAWAHCRIKRLEAGNVVWWKRGGLWLITLYVKWLPLNGEANENETK